MAGALRVLPLAPEDLASRIARGERYAGYAYAYPHKTAYRALTPPRRIGPLFADEIKDALSLYVHVPFCEVRCGFCNLFALRRPDDHTLEGYVAALERQAGVVKAEIGDARFAQVAVGGGTPSYLPIALFGRVLEVIATMGAGIAAVPSSIEVSPSTASREHVAAIRAAGFERVSVGVESFTPSALAAIGRPQRVGDAELAIGRLRAAGIPRINLDLIYGAQSHVEWADDLDRALAFEPEELYLYPLYVRPCTGLERRGATVLDRRATLYAQGRERLLDAGYEQVSMRMFRRQAPQRAAVHRCQEDGMVGLGCGARSYTRALHWSEEWAAAQTPIEQILAKYIARPEHRFAYASYGVALDEHEQHRRWVIQGILQRDGIDTSELAQRGNLPELDELRALDLAADIAGSLRLTEEGLGYSDLIGPYLYSGAARAASDAFVAR